MAPSYFKNDIKLTSRDPHKQLIASLTRLVTDFPPTQMVTGGGLYYGPTSIAYLFFVLQQYYPDTLIEDTQLGKWSAAYLTQAQNHWKSYPGPRVGKCGVMDDTLALLAVGAANSKDRDMAKVLCSWSRVVVGDETENEWLYGRAGYLYFLRLVKASFAYDEDVTNMINDTANKVVEMILDMPRPWKWHGKAYIGAVHGIIGTITQIVLTDHKYARSVEAELSEVLSCQFESGNWPSSLPAGSDRLVQVCHGAPGVVNCLQSIREYFPELRDRIDRSIEKGRACILQRGLLLKESCLCHGISGNALALDDKECAHFLSYTTGHEMKSLERNGLCEKSDHPEGLFTGEAGRAWAWAIVDRKLPKRLLGFNDL